MKLGKRGKHETLAEAVERIQALSLKAERNANKFTDMYVNETVKEATTVVKNLSKRLDALQAAENQNEEATLRLVDEMFDILMDARKGLSDTEYNYTFWTDLDDKYNGQ